MISPVSRAQLWVGLVGYDSWIQYMEWEIHHSDVIMSEMTSQIISASIVCSVCSGADRIKHQSCASLPFVRGIRRWPGDSPHKEPVTQKMFLLDDVIMQPQNLTARVIVNKLTWRMLYRSPWHSCHTHAAGDQPYSWWRHQMETFSALLALCAGNSPVPGEFPSQRPVARSLDVFFDLRVNTRLSKQSRRWWFETPSRSLPRRCNDKILFTRATHWVQNLFHSLLMPLLDSSK